MTCNLCVIAHDAIASDEAIMSQMAISHDQAIFPNLRFATVFSATVDSNKLTNGCLIANLNQRVFTFKFQILRNGSDHSTWKYAAVFPYPGSFHNCHIAADPCAIANFHILMDH